MGLGARVPLKRDLKARQVERDREGDEAARVDREALGDPFGEDRDEVRPVDDARSDEEARKGEDDSSLATFDRQESIDHGRAPLRRRDRDLERLGERSQRDLTGCERRMLTSREADVALVEQRDRDDALVAPLFVGQADRGVGRPAQENVIDLVAAVNSDDPYVDVRRDFEEPSHERGEQDQGG